jgi:hypothetical protein
MGHSEAADFTFRMQSTHLTDGRMALYYTTKSNVRLSRRFAGLSLIKATEMISDLTEFDGMVIQGNEGVWFAADKRKLAKILGHVRRPNTNQLNCIFADKLAPWVGYT